MVSHTVLIYTTRFCALYDSYLMSLVWASISDIVATNYLMSGFIPFWVILLVESGSPLPSCRPTTNDYTMCGMCKRRLSSHCSSRHTKWNVTVTSIEVNTSLQTCHRRMARAKWNDTQSYTAILVRCLAADITLYVCGECIGLGLCGVLIHNVLNR